jgi:DNA end-binding protein Ku
MRELIQAKLEGGEAFTTEEQPKELEPTEDVSDLLARLEASVKRRRSEGDGAPAKKTPAKKAAGKKVPAKKAAAKKTPAKKAAAKR